MSCDGNRTRYVAALAGEETVRQALGGEVERARQILETLYDTACQRQDVPPALADALTRLLFGQMQRLGIRPPTHATDGLPKPSARQGYAALAQTLLAIRGGRALPALAAQIAQAIPHPAAVADVEPPMAALEAYGARSRRGGDSSEYRLLLFRAGHGFAARERPATGEGNPRGGADELRSACRAGACPTR